MSRLVRFLALASLGWIASLPACKGDGSDIGPSFAALPSGTCRVTVRDDDGIGVSGAYVRVGDGAGVTGRSGRAELYGFRSGPAWVRVDATNASASNSDRLASIGFVTTIPGPDLPDVVYLPNTSASAVVTVAVGVALPQTELDDTANTGAILRLDAGVVVADAGRPEVALRLGALAREHLPIALPSTPGGSWVCSRGYWIDPPSASFAPGATLSVPDELGLGAATCALWRLDPTSGQWQQVVGAAASSGGRIQLAGGITTAGLYVYAVAAPSTNVRGRIVDAEDRPVAGAYVRVDSVPTRTNLEGRFGAQVAALDGQGIARNVAVEVVGGGDWLPVESLHASGPLAVGVELDLGDLELDTTYANDVRIQLLRRGRGQTDLRVGASGVAAAVSSEGYTDALGQCRLEDIPAGWFCTNFANPVYLYTVAMGELFSFVAPGSRVVSNRYYLTDRSFYSAGDFTNILAIDSQASGRVQGAAVVLGRVPLQGYVGLTGESGVVGASRRVFDRVTASVSTRFDGRTTTSAFSFEAAAGDRIEMPLLRQQRVVPGRFDRHGVVRGRIAGFDPLRDQQVLASRPLEYGEWFSARMQGEQGPARMPVRTGGLLPQGSYVAGVAVPSGNVAVAEGTIDGGRFTLTRAGALFDLQVGEGSALAADLGLSQPATETFVARGLLTALDAQFTAADLRFDLAFQLPSGRVAEIARNVGGNLQVVGSDLSLTLPSLAGPFQGGAWLVALAAVAGEPTSSRMQRTMIRFHPAGYDISPLMALPTIQSPTEGAAVAAAGFQVQFTAPAGASYVRLDLRSPGEHTRVWSAVLPAYASEFAFVQLPTEAVSPLAPGLAWTLEVSAWRLDVGPYLGNYGELPTLWRSLGAGVQGVRVGSSRTIAITTN